jgi:thiamine pyrophosphate-dependent acetolactate synthase large subunit-like protein
MTVHAMGAQRLDRRWVASTLLADRGDTLVVAGVGSTVWDCAAAGDSHLTFPLWNAMGAAAMVGLGLALAQPRRPVLVITGDGELLMQLGALATIAAKKPQNLSIVVMDNEAYQETGGQPTHTALGTSIAAVAAGCGFENAAVLQTEDEVVALASSVRAMAGLRLAQVKIGRQKAPRVMPPRDGAWLKDRFRAALLGEAAAFR